MDDLKIREFKLDDYAEVTRLWMEAGLGFRLGDDLDSVKAKVGRDPDLFLVAEERRRIVGSVMGAWDGRRGWIYHLGVLPEARRKGVASKLMEELEGRMREKGVSKVNGLVYRWNKASLSFFTRSGYEVQTMKEVEKLLIEPKHKLIAPDKRPQAPRRR